MIVFLILLAAIYFISRITINSLFDFIGKLVHNEKVTFSLISIIFLPGTLIHEAAHFLTAIILLLKVRSMSIFPRFADNYIQLGRVEYEKRDAIRGLLVGLAPLLIGVLILGWLSIFPLNLLTGYMIFIVSSTMFSSRQDLQDLLVLIPLAVIIAGIFYIFNIKLDIIVNSGLIGRLMSISGRINIYLLITLAIHTILIIFLKCLNILLNR